MIFTGPFALPSLLPGHIHSISRKELEAERAADGRRTWWCAARSWWTRSRTADALAVRGGRVVALGARDCRTWWARAPRSWSLRGWSPPASSTPTCTRSWPGSTGCAATSTTCTTSTTTAPASVPHLDCRVSGSSGRVGTATSSPAASPTADELDRLVGDRPALPDQPRRPRRLGQHRRPAPRRHHDTTPDPAGGRIQRDADGRATGFLIESAADLVDALVPRPDTAELLVAALLEAQRTSTSDGIVGWQDAAVGEMLGMPDLFPVYRGRQPPAGSPPR